MTGMPELESELELYLGMMQLSDSFFPTGLFATSNGLEGLFLEKRISGIAELTGFIRACLEQQVGPSDCVILANVMEWCAPDMHYKIRHADELYCAMKTVQEAREASVRSGMQLARCVKEFQADNTLEWYWHAIQEKQARGGYPVALGVCCNALKITKQQAVLMLLYGFAAGTAGAALRLGIIHHFEGQKMIHELKPLISRIATWSAAKPLEEAWQFAPYLEISQMHHERMDSKMFIT